MNPITITTLRGNQITATPVYSKNSSVDTVTTFETLGEWVTFNRFAESAGAISFRVATIVTVQDGHDM